MGKKLVLLGFFAFFVLLSGCLKITVDQKIDSSGVLGTHMAVDFSQIAKSPAGGVNSASPDSNAACDSQKKQFEKKGFLISFGCQATEGHRIIIDAKEQLPVTIFKKEENFFQTNYRYDLGKYSEVSLAAQQPASDQNAPNPLPENFNELTAAQIQQLALIGFDANYSIQMPGIISSTSIGKIQNNKVNILLEEFWKLSDPSTPKIIVSTEYGLLLPVVIGIVLFVALVGVGLLLYFFVLKKKQAASGPGSQNLQVQQENVFYPNPPQMQPAAQQPRQPFSKGSQAFNQQPVLSDSLRQIPQVQRPPMPQQPLSSHTPQFAGAENAGMQPQPPANRPAQFSFNYPKSREQFAEQKPVLETRQPKSGVLGFGAISGAQPEQPLRPQPAPIQGQFVSQKPKLPPEQPVSMPVPLRQFGGLSPEEESDVKSLVAVLGPEKQGYSSDQIMLVVLEKGYSKKVADEIIRRIYG